MRFGMAQEIFSRCNYYLNTAPTENSSLKAVNEVFYSSSPSLLMETTFSRLDSVKAYF